MQKSRKKRAKEKGGFSVSSLVETENLVLLFFKMRIAVGILLGLTRSHARAKLGERAYDYKPFYRGSKVSVIGAITVSKVLAVMTLDDSMDAAAFKVYVSKCLVPQLWRMRSSGNG